MSSAKQNVHIANLIVGAMSIDGELNKWEREKLAATLEKLGMDELIAYVGAAIEDNHGDINMFEECRGLSESLGSAAEEAAPVIFQLIIEVLASDHFVSASEANYLSAVGKRLGLEIEQAKEIFKTTMQDCDGRLEIGSSQVDEFIHPNLKELLNFPGAEDLVGELDKEALQEKMKVAQSNGHSMKISLDALSQSLSILGLRSSATLEDAEEVWKDTIDSLNLPKMANLGETYVTAAIKRISDVTAAYRTVLHFNQQVEQT